MCKEKSGMSGGYQFGIWNSFHYSIPIFPFSFSSPIHPALCMVIGKGKQKQGLILHSQKKTRKKRRRGGKENAVLAPDNSNGFPSHLSFSWSTYRGIYVHSDYSLPLFFPTEEGTLYVEKRGRRKTNDFHQPKQAFHLSSDEIWTAQVIAFLPSIIIIPLILIFF